MTFTILILHLRYDAPKLEERQKLLKRSIDEPAEEYFRRGSKQAKAFNKLKIVCNAGWKLETSRLRKWNLCYVANNSALLLVLWGQVKKELEEQEANKKATRSVSMTGVPKATDLKRAFTKLWNAYDKPLRNYVAEERKKKNVVHHSFSLSSAKWCTQSGLCSVGIVCEVPF
jgi:hypothetical protein